MMMTKLLADTLEKKVIIVTLTKSSRDTQQAGKSLLVQK
jgi:hypothetical protein